VCNFNCRLCGINKPNYDGPVKFQEEAVTRQLINRIRQAAISGIRFRIITNSGSGEPTMHPEFAKNIKFFGDLIRNWPTEKNIPELTIVTNGSTLLNPDIIRPLCENPITVNISFPTSNEEKYWEMMLNANNSKKHIFKLVINGIDKIMKYHASGQIQKIYFHISPPVYNRQIHDLSATFSFLCERAANSGLKQINIVMFPDISNRSGLIKSENNSVNQFSVFFKIFNKTKIHNVEINMENVWNRFFKFREEVEELCNVFKYPCIWNANLFITAEGDSICCNDQAVKSKLGNLSVDSIETLYARKENLLNYTVCCDCNQRDKVSYSIDETLHNCQLDYNLEKKV